jgi:predicted ATP-grasp superfamily ATP-dependent carboligase
MRIFVYEHITGGGCLDQALPPSLAHEGELMLRALLDDLRDVPGTEVLIMRDPRLSVFDAALEVWRPKSKAEAWNLFRHCCMSADAVWPVAPETDGALKRLSSEVLACGRILLGSRPEALAIAASKTLTAEALAQAGVPVVETYRRPAQLPADIQEVVIKPDDGAGCQDTHRFARADAIDWWNKTCSGNYVLQPYLHGDARSLSLLCDGESALLLSCNEQQISIEGSDLRFVGVKVNAVQTNRDRYAQLARQIAGAIPGLWGYVGVDLIETSGGPVVIEINPRLTTSYAGLRQALGSNPAALVLALLDSGAVSQPRPALTSKVATCHA